jgi:hypothetical protein
MGPISEESDEEPGPTCNQSMMDVSCLFEFVQEKTRRTY